MPTMQHIQQRKSTLAWTLANPEHHEQSTWVNAYGSCGTTACLAGTTIMIHKFGARWLGDVKYDNYEELWDIYCNTVGSLADRNGVYDASAEVAADLLGIDDTLAHWLFLESSNEDALATMKFLAGQSPDSAGTLTTLDDVLRADIGVRISDDEDNYYCCDQCSGADTDYGYDDEDY